MGLATSVSTTDALKTMLNRRAHPDLVAPVRRGYRTSKKPWVIENVFGIATQKRNMLCGIDSNSTSSTWIPIDGRQVL